MEPTPLTSVCIPPLMRMLLGGAVVVGFVHVVWDYFKNYFEIVRKVCPDLAGVSLLLTPMLRPFLMLKKEAREQPEYKRLWRPALIPLASFLALALIFFAFEEFGCLPSATSRGASPGGAAKASEITFCAGRPT